MPNAPYTIIACPEIITMDERHPVVDAVGVLGERICCTGSLDRVRAFAGGKVDHEIRMSEGTLFPGFIDSHSHLSMYAQCREQFFCDSALGSLKNILTGLREHGATYPDQEWLRGYCYDDTGIPEQRHLTRHDLDAVCMNRPIFVVHITCHLGYLNTLGLEKLGITADTRVEGGEVCLGSDGKPDGLLKENAFYQLAMSKVPGSGGEFFTRHMENAIADYNRQGFTMFQDGGIGLSGTVGDVLGSYVRLAREKRLAGRAYLHFLPDVMDELLDRGMWGVTIDNHVFFGGVKYFVDGSIQSLTAALNTPYHSTPEHRGEPVCSAKFMNDLVLRYHSLGVPVAIHANGDRGIEMVTVAFERALAACPRKVPGHMLIHAQMASDEHLKRLWVCGVTPSFFARHITVWGDRHVNMFLGRERAARLDPTGSCVRMGLPFSLHVDTPVQPCSALKSIHSAVNRITSGGQLLGPDQRISPMEAMRAYTTHAAYGCGLGHTVGHIAPGYYADFTLLDRNPERVPPETIETLRVLRTISGGKTVFEA